MGNAGKTHLSMRWSRHDHCLSSFGFSLSSLGRFRVSLSKSSKFNCRACLLFSLLLLYFIFSQVPLLQYGTGTGPCAHTVFAIITAPIRTAELLHPPRHLTSHLCWHSNRLHTSPLDSSLDLSSRLSLEYYYLLFYIAQQNRVGIFLVR